MAWLRAGMRVHLVGIGGIGLSAIARVLHAWGYQVSGSDRQSSALTAALAAEGIHVTLGHRAENLPPGPREPGDTLVIVSSAVSDDNPEVVEARRCGIPVVKRDRILRDLTAGKDVIAVAGTHGKTTTSAMIAWILLQAGMDPTFIVGGLLQNLGTNARAGTGRHFVIEADEYDRAFLGLWPNLSVVTIVEHDHPDCYPAMDDMLAAFAQFVHQTSGTVVVCDEDKHSRELGSTLAGAAGLYLQASVPPRGVTYGFGPGCDWQAEDVELGGSPVFMVRHAGKRLGTCALQLPGRHNVLNALAALAASVEVGVDFGMAVAALTRFQGTARRFEVKGQAAGVTAIDDYAHHPTEIRATLAAARSKYPGRPIWAVFQPHTYSRTAALLDEFADAFHDADHVLVTDIYAAREANPLAVSSADLVARIRSRMAATPRDAVASEVHYIPTLEGAVQALRARVRPGDLVLTLGAGDGYLVGEQLLQSLQEAGSRPEAGQRAAALSNPERSLSREPLAVLADRLSRLLGEAPVYANEPLARHTTLRVGGPADLLVVVHSADALIQAVALAWESGLSCRVLGSGANVLVGDAGFRGLVVINRARGMAFSQTSVTAESGATFALVARESIARALSGLEWAVGIPGTVGGAVVGNAGAWGSNVASSLETAKVLEPDRGVCVWPVAALGYAYRSSILKRQAFEVRPVDASAARLRLPVVLEAQFRLQPGDRSALEARAEEITTRRKASQPPGSSCGSVFKNPPGDFAGRLIEAAGLKGQWRGQAQVSPLHGNFIVNHGRATATDVKALIDLAAQQVFARFGVSLELEVELVGEW